MTRIRHSDLPWHQSLEQWCAQHIGHRRQSIQDQADFAPFEAHKPEKFHQTAVVLVVLTSATRSLQRGFAEAAELIRASTSAFRAVLVTDLYQPPALEVCDWPVEQLLAEETWSAHQQSNWLAQATEHLRSAQQSYGGSYIIAPAGAESAAAALRHLAYVYNAPTPVLTQALEIFAEATDDDAAAPLGFRHGWDTLTAGEGQLRTFVSAEGDEVSVEVHCGSGRGVVVDPGGRLPDGLLQAARSAGWSTGVVTAVPQGSGGTGSFAANVQRACAEALHAGGPVLVGPAAEGPLVTSADGRIGPEMSAGVDSAAGAEGSVGQWRIALESVAVVRFAPEQAPEVLTRLQSLTSTLLCR